MQIDFSAKTPMYTRPMSKRDYYEILGIAKQADPSDIKKAYRRLALENHPDRNPGDTAAEERFKESSEAYEVLSDPQKRQLYDAYGHRGLGQTGFTGFHDVEDVFSSFGSVFADLFGDLGFGGGRGRARSNARAGAHVEAELTISFEEAALGGQKDITVERAAACTTCVGSGAQPGTKRETCSVCGGAGHVTSRQGFFVMQTTCPTCHGEGTRLRTPCDDCRGHGVVRDRKTLQVKIPAGIADGMQLVMRGEGHAGASGGPAGDLYVAMTVTPHTHFRREGDDVYYRATIAFPQAALGTRLTVPTLYGKQEIKIPAGTDSGETIRLKGAGIQNVQNHHRGDQYVEVWVETPKKLSRHQRKLLEEFMHESSEE